MEQSFFVTLLVSFLRSYNYLQTIHGKRNNSINARVSDAIVINYY